MTCLCPQSVAMLLLLFFSLYFFVYLSPFHFKCFTTSTGHRKNMYERSHNKVEEWCDNPIDAAFFSFIFFLFISLYFVHVSSPFHFYLFNSTDHRKNMGLCLQMNEATGMAILSMLLFFLLPFSFNRPAKKCVFVSSDEVDKVVEGHFFFLFFFFFLFIFILYYPILFYTAIEKICVRVII